VLVRHLAHALKNKVVRDVMVRRAKVLRPSSEQNFKARLVGAKFRGVSRRGKYLLFEMQPAKTHEIFRILGHLGMTGRMYLQPAKDSELHKHAAVVLNLGTMDFVYEDVRYFGRLTLDLSALERMGPEPFGDAFTPQYFADALKRSSQAIKVKLLDQSLVAGVGNIYASEALYRAGISPKRKANQLNAAQIARLHGTICDVLDDAITGGSTVPLDWGGKGKRDGLFYYGQRADVENHYEERLRVYDRRGQPCLKCKTPIKRITQAARSTYYCPQCQK
jgi:formamidopyrimidine-DNA glycosylase